MIIGIDASRAFVKHPTGTENYSYRVITHLLALPEAKIHFFVLFIRPNAKLPSEVVGYPNVLIKEIKYRYLWTQVGLAMFTWRKYQIPSTNNQIQNPKQGLDVLWVMAHTLPILCNPKIKTVVTIHGLEYRWLREYSNRLQRWYLPLSTYYVAKQADKLICVSEATKRDLMNEVYFDAEKISVIYEGVEKNEQMYKRTKAQYGLKSKKYILFVGSVQPRKNLVALVEAFSQLRLQLRGDTSQIKLVIAGGIGWMAEEILRAPGRCGIQERVVFTGRVTEEDLRELYLGALVYVQPSITEGFGLPVLEAMAYGVPVITSDGGALSEVVGQAGVVVPLQNPNSKIETGFVDRLAGAMERVVKDKKLRNKLITMGLKRANELSWAKTAKASLEVLVGERL